MSELAVESEPAPASSPAPASRPISRWWCPLIGVAAAVSGLVPWLITGIRLPLQNLWASNTLPEQMPLALLPFSQYYLFLIFGLIVVGSAVAGIAARALRPRLRSGGGWLIALGVLVVQVAAFVQTAIVVRDGLQQRTEAMFYWAALVAVTVVSILIGMLVLALIAAAPRAGALIGLAGAAIAMGPWLSGLIAPLWLGYDWLYLPLTQAIRWVPAILVGAAIVWAGVTTVGRVLAALFSLVVLWVGPALIDGVAGGAGMRVLAHDIPAMIDVAGQIFLTELLTRQFALPRLVVAVVVAVVGLVGRYALGRARGSRAVS